MAENNADNKITEEEKTIMVCPRCKSPDVDWDRSNPLISMGVPRMYICNKCNHAGYNFPEVSVSELPELKAEATEDTVSSAKKDDSQLVDVAYGNFVVRVIWKVLAPIWLLVGVCLMFTDLALGSLVTILGGIATYITYFKKRELRK